MADAASVACRLAFDHLQLAEALRGLGHGHQADAAMLPISVTAVESGAIEFVLMKRRCRCRLSDGDRAALGEVERTHGPSRSPG